MAVQQEVVIYVNGGGAKIVPQGPGVVVKEGPPPQR